MPMYLTELFTWVRAFQTRVQIYFWGSKSTQAKHPLNSVNVIVKRTGPKGCSVLFHMVPCTQILSSKATSAGVEALSSSFWKLVVNQLTPTEIVWSLLDCLFSLVSLSIIFFLPHVHWYITVFECWGCWQELTWLFTLKFSSVPFKHTLGHLCMMFSCMGSNFRELPVEFSVW